MPTEVSLALVLPVVAALVSALVWIARELRLALHARIEDLKQLTASHSESARESREALAETTKAVARNSQVLERLLDRLDTLERHQGSRNGVGW